MINLENLFSACWIMDCYYYSWINNNNKRFNRQMVVAQNYKKRDLEKHLNNYIDATILYIKVEKVIFIINDSDLEEYDRNLYDKGNLIDKYWRDMSLYVVTFRTKVNNYNEELDIQCIAPIDIENSELKKRIISKCIKEIEINQVNMHEDCWLKKN